MFFIALLLCVWPLLVLAEKTVQVDQKDPSIVYQTDPNSSDPTWADNVTGCPTKQQLTYRVGDSATFTFTGTGITIYGTIGTLRGRITFQLDGGTLDEFDRTANALQCSQVIYQTTGLDYKEHKLVATLIAKEPSQVQDGSPMVGVLSIQGYQYTTPDSTSSSSSPGPTGSGSASHGKSNNVPIIAGAAAGGGTLLLLALLALCLVLRRKNRQHKSTTQTPNGPPPANVSVMAQVGQANPGYFGYQQPTQSPPAGTHGRTPSIPGSAVSVQQPLPSPESNPMFIPSRDSPAPLLSPRLTGSNVQTPQDPNFTNALHAGTYSNYNNVAPEDIMNHPDFRRSLQGQPGSQADDAMISRIAQQVAEIVLNSNATPNASSNDPPAYTPSDAPSARSSMVTTGRRSELVHSPVLPVAQEEPANRYPGGPAPAGYYGMPEPMNNQNDVPYTTAPEPMSVEPSAIPPGVIGNPGSQSAYSFYPSSTAYYQTSPAPAPNPGYPSNQVPPGARSDSSHLPPGAGRPQY